MGLIHSHQQHPDVFFCDRPTCWIPTHQHHSGIFNLFVLRVGRCHTHALPLIHRYQLFLNHRRADTGEENPHLSFFIFSSCFGESLWFRYATKVDSLTCLDIFACSLSVCFLRYFKDKLNISSFPSLLSVFWNSVTAVSNSLIVLEH